MEKEREEAKINGYEDPIHTTKNDTDKDYNKASNVFGELMTVKISDILDQEKIKLADQIYNGVDGAEDEEQLDLDLDNGDEELSDESAEVEDSDEGDAEIDNETDDESEEAEEE